MKCLKCDRVAIERIRTPIGKKVVRYTFFHCEPDERVTQCEFDVTPEASKLLDELRVDISDGGPSEDPTKS